MSNVEMRPLLEVLQGYRDHFRQGGMDVHPVDDGHHGSSRCHGINDFLNKDGRIGTDNMESQKATVFFSIMILAKLSSSFISFFRLPIGKALSHSVRVKRYVLIAKRPVMLKKGNRLLFLWKPPVKR